MIRYIPPYFIQSKYNIPPFKYNIPSLCCGFAFHIFIINFDETVVPRVPLGEDVPYRANEAPVGTEHTLLEKEGKKLYRFFKGGDDTLPGMKIESMFIQMLEGLHATEAEVLIKAVNKTLHKKYRITQAVVKEAFPGIEWGGRS